MGGGNGRPVITSVTDVYSNWMPDYTVTLTIDPERIYTKEVSVKATFGPDSSTEVWNNVTLVGGDTLVVEIKQGYLKNLPVDTRISWTVTSIFESDPFLKSVIGLPSGGSITTIGSDRIHTYTSNGTLVVPHGFGRSMRSMLVAGGGGGGGKESGGGGAGGMIDTYIDVPDGSHSVVIGLGGQGGYGGYKERDNGLNGTNSSFRTLTAIGGGGGGGTAREIAPGNGGSGGGAGHGIPPGTGVSGQGNRGGSYSNSQGSSGGGGAGGVGGDQVGLSRGGHGGPGRYSDISGTNTAYAGGGGGCLNTGYGTEDSRQGQGGVGGGGKSGKGDKVITAGSPVNGVNGLGGGGGSGGWDGDWFSGQTGGKGGSGIVIIRYKVT